MEDDRRIYAAAALVVALAAGYSLYGARVAPKKSVGPGWFSRISPFGSPPSQEPAPASAVPAPELAPPEKMMANAMTRQFSNPSGGNSGGLAGADASATSSASEYAASMPASRLGAGVDVNLPGGGRAPTAGGAFGGGARGPDAPVGGGRGGGAGRVGGSGSGGGGGSESDSGGAKAAGGSAGASAASSSGLTANVGGASAAKLGGGSGGGPGIKGGTAGQLSGSSSGGGGGPPGGDSGGGKGGGIDAKAPEVTGKDMAKNAAKDHAGATKEGEGAAGASAASPASATGGRGGTGAGNQGAPPAAVIGAPDLGTTTVPGGMFRLQPGGPPEVPTTVNITPTGARLVSFTAKMAIDADGSAEAARTDPTGQTRTALAYKDGTYLNSETLPFIVVPTDFHRTHPDVKLGDYVAVTYGAKTVYAIVGDTGPAGVVGEGSMALASGLGIDPDPVKGGIQRKDVRYVIIPGSKDAEPPRSAAEIAKRGQALFAAAGAPVR